MNRLGRMKKAEMISFQGGWVAKEEVNKGFQLTRRPGKAFVA